MLSKICEGDVKPISDLVHETLIRQITNDKFDQMFDKGKGKNP